MRELQPALTALIATGHCNWHTAIDLILTSELELHLSSGDLLVDSTQYLAQLKEIGEFGMSLGEEMDQIDFSIQNADLVIGRVFTTATRQMDGAKGTLGTIFIDTNTGDKYYSAKMPGELVTSAVGETEVEFSMPSDIDAIVISGRTISSEFPWREPIHRTPEVIPQDAGGTPNTIINPGGHPAGWHEPWWGPGGIIRDRYLVD